MTPQYKNTSMDQFDATPVSVPGVEQPQLFRNLTSVSRARIPAVVNHYNIQPEFDIFANVQGRDLGGVAREVDKVVAEFQKKLAPMRGSRGCFIRVADARRGLRIGYKGWGGYSLPRLKIVDSASKSSSDKLEGR